MQDTIENLEGEIWKNIPGYEGKYMVSSFGRVYSCIRYIDNNGGIKKIGGIIIKQAKHKHGYTMIRLNNGYRHKMYLVHRLVASAFLGLDLSGFKEMKTSLCVCHKDDIRDNNNISNLFIGTSMDNTIDKINKGRCPSGKIHPHYNRKGLLHPMSKIVFQYDLRGNFINEWSSTTDAGENLGIPRTSIGRCCNGKQYQAGGYKWRYKKNTDLTQFLEDCQEDLLMIHS